MHAPTDLTPATLRRMPLPRPQGGSKEERGRILVVGGSRELPGAPLLAGRAALRAGAGKLQVATLASLALGLGLALPEARVIGLDETQAGGIAPAALETLLPRVAACAALLVGPGMMDAEAVARLTRDLLLGCDGPALVLDAAAMMRLRADAEALRRHRGRAIITPHPGEMAGLLGIDKREVEADPVGIARRTAASLGCIVILKGACTRICTPEGEAWASAHGPVGLATSGSGDTLAGLLLGLLGRGAAPLQAALWAVHVHAEAGRRLGHQVGPLGFLAGELPGQFPGILADLAPTAP
ncbi:NAD(P)H-hydrate dehydratase [Methylobacterium soli]|uniref:ADP-dependent (S)-NAD(P)H-hydrate dehydratase n=1 Tax=Methylobacterium soli TaxID=553447 RepID=A0A6L3T0F6_9HYPH|nr:NAD(P)H-hydrate dehydratase [Methylobacterium soli]KAB1079931.1 NAD(P)H-hydrate dehydratase [Methylobacterium soli]GJE43201.1 Bifunctional NAD(P)H-hydrate repair enzyme Nnr [Methylobacterium soli]